VTRGDFSDRFTKVTKAEARKVKDLWLMPGDILIQRSNTPELVGTSALYEGPPDWAIFPDLMIRLRCDEEQVNPAYLATVLASERTHRTLRSRAKGLAGSMPKIDQGAIATLSIPVPADALHRKAIVDRIRAASDASARLTSVIESSQRQGDQLRRALLSSAFAGRLTATRDVPSMIGEMAGV
jgi:type I restriction enzyme S subunit